MKKTFDSINAQAARQKAYDYAKEHNLVLLGATTYSQNPAIETSWWNCDAEFGQSVETQEAIMTATREAYLDTDNINAV